LAVLDRGAYLPMTTIGLPSPTVLTSARAAESSGGGSAACYKTHIYITYRQ
jgi:hypothetical protein